MCKLTIKSSMYLAMIPSDGKYVQSLPRIFEQGSYLCLFSVVWHMHSHADPLPENDT